MIWAGFAALAFASFMAWVVVALPPAPFWNNQAAYETAFGTTWRIALASLIAFSCGEFVNSFVLAKMKVWMAGKHLWMRTIGSTIFGEGVDSMLFYPLAFWGTGIIPDDKLPMVMLAQFVTKVGVEVVFTPVTYKVVAWLKRAGRGGPLRQGHQLHAVVVKGLSTLTVDRVEPHSAANGSAQFQQRSNGPGEVSPHFGQWRARIGAPRFVLVNDLPRMARLVIALDPHLRVGRGQRHIAQRADSVFVQHACLDTRIEQQIPDQIRFRDIGGGVDFLHCMATEGEKTAAPECPGLRFSGSSGVLRNRPPRLRSRHPA